MLNDHLGPNGHTDGNRDSVRRESSGAPLGDREVPLNPRSTPAVVHAWLDGEVSMAEAMRGDTVKDVEFWKQINEQAEVRRHMRTPVHVQQRIMEAIPHNAPVAHENSWLQKDAHIRNGGLILLGAALVGLGMAAALLFR